MTDDINTEWLVDIYVDDHGIDGAVAELQSIYDDSFDDRADRALAVLSAVRQRKEVRA